MPIVFIGTALDVVADIGVCFMTLVANPDIDTFIIQVDNETTKQLNKAIFDAKTLRFIDE